jgi:molecular chaperone GrpE
MTEDLSKKDASVDMSHESKVQEAMTEEEENIATAEIVAEDTSDVLREEIANLKEANQDIQNKLLRSFADLENYRKRAEKSLDDSNKYAIAGFAKDIIRVADNLDRALQAVTAVAVDEKLIEDFKTGLIMTQKELNSIFEKHAICPINPIAGDIFDHNEHQAVAHIEIPDIKAGCIASVMQIGYKVHDRLLRPAMVAVAK